MKQFSQVVDIKTRVSDMKILCTVDQDVNTLFNSTNIQPISFKFYMWVDIFWRYFAIEI